MVVSVTARHGLYFDSCNEQKRAGCTSRLRVKLLFFLQFAHEGALRQKAISTAVRAGIVATLNATSGGADEGREWCVIFLHDLPPFSLNFVPIVDGGECPGHQTAVGKLCS